jgi:hypothetical protein
MPTPALPRIKTLTQLDNHTVELQTKDNRAYSIFQYLLQYDYDPASGGHPMPHFRYVVPTNGIKIEFDPGNSEMVYDGNPYSTLNSDQKAIFWQWIDRAIVIGLKNYDKTYGF